MTFEVTPLEEKVEAARNHFESELPNTDAWLWPNNIAVSAKVMGGIFHEAELSLQTVYRQMFPDTADGNNLRRWALMLGITPKEASKARGVVSVTGGVGDVIPISALFSRSDGLTFSPLSPLTISDLGTGQATATNQIEVIATAEGFNHNTLPAASLTVTNVAGTVSSDSAVGAAGIVGGADEESEEELRSRVLQRLKYPPGVGSPSDYERWVKSVNGVTRVKVQRLAFGTTTVGVWFMMDNSYDNGIPLPGDVANVKAVLDMEAPLTAAVNVAAPLPVAIDVEVVGTNIMTTSKQLQLRDEITRALRTSGAINGVGESYNLSTQVIWAAVSRVTGDVTHTLVHPATDVLIPESSVPTLGSLTVTS